jgi:prepilin-type N-terminal cleavage/methylation domain-containing protein
MISNTFKRGFTLIELLVVIAIIGILASVVLASLNSARAKGSDAAIKSNVNNARAQAELFYDSQSPSSYTNVCTAAGGIAPMLAAAENAAGGAGFAACGQSATAWALKARLVSNTGQFYCVDSTGNAEVITATYTDSFTTPVCP